MARSNGKMNFLAHLYLSGDQPETLCGNFIGDGVKGNIAQQYDDNVRIGVELHRFIDHFTDNHDITAEARKIIRPHFRKYAGVVLDVYFDHFLGKDWHQYHPQQLEQFVAEKERILHDFSPEMPPKSKRFFTYMVASRCLVRYRDFDGLHQVFVGMANRTPFQSNMEFAVPVLKENYREMQQTFERFFPELQEASARFLEEKQYKYKP